MSKTLVVFGATGHQGGSVVDFVLNDPELSQQYNVRAVTRDADSDKAKTLQKGRQIEVVQGNVQDPKSLEKVLTGAHTVFVMTTPSFGPNALDAEYSSGKAVADIAVERGAQYIIFSTLPSVRDITHGKCTALVMFDAKAKIEQYIRGLPIKSAFYAAGSFMENFHEQPFMAPRKGPDGVYVLARNVSPQSKLPLLDASGDTGKFIGAILAQPEKYEGKTFCGATRLYDFEEIVAELSKATGKTVRYEQLSDDEFGKTIPFMADVFVEGGKYMGDIGYFGFESEKLVEWAASNARGKLTTLEEYWQAHPIHLE